MTPEGANKKEPSPAEALLFFSILKHNRIKPDVDWDAVAEENGLKNSGTAKVRFGQIKRKLGLDSPEKSATVGGNVSSPGRVTKSTPRKPRGRAKKGVPKEEADDDQDDVFSGSQVKPDTDMEDGHEDVKMDMFNMKA